MSAEEFWHGPFRLAAAYREAHEARCDMRYMAEWRAGIYVKEALATVVDHAVNRNASSSYPEEPLFSSEGARKQIEEIRERRALERMRDVLRAKAEAINRRFARQGDKAAK